MRLHDTRAGTSRVLVAGHTVRVYVCGITPYDATHLGHAFTYVVFDVLVRVLERRGHRVRYVRNITDIDDDLLRTATARGVDFLTLAERETARFDLDLAALGLRVPDAAPRATDAIPAIVTAVGGLVGQDLAYVLNDGRVYFDVGRAGTRFGALSRLGRDEMLRQFAEKGGDPDAPGKRDALDFLLWQPSGAGEPAWPSPWGPGRPGWHIECSVMAMEELGAVLDIHGGGNDLIFPHHEAEILQSEGLTGQGPFARFWVHVGMVGLGGEKMSKSQSNLVFVRDLLERVEPAAVRRYLLEHHYRTDWSFDDDGLVAADRAVKRWHSTIADSARDPDAEEAFMRSLGEDLDTPAAIDVLDELAAAGTGGSLRRLADVLGFDLGSPTRGHD